MNLLQLCVYLQLLDLLTTLSGLAHGKQELNPLINMGPYPIVNMLVLKLIGVGFGTYWWYHDKPNILRYFNWWFAGVVVWNLVWMVI